MPNFRGSPKVVRRVLTLGTGAVSTGTHLLGMAEVKGRVLDIRFAGQAAVTGTSITGEVFKRSADGDSTTSLQSAAKDLKLVAASDEVEQTASLSTVAGALDLTKDQLLEVTITCNAVTAGPGDVVVEVVIEPRG